MALQRLVDHFRTPPPEVSAAQPLRTQAHAAEALVAEASEQLRLAQEAAAAERRQQAELRDASESLRTLAQLALRHLGDRCPVCDQDYDMEATRARLQQFVDQDDVPVIATGTSVSARATQLEELQRNLANVQAALRAAEASEANRAGWDRTMSAFAEDAGFSAATPDLLAHAQSGIEVSSNIIADIQRLRSAGEQFSRQLARAVEHSQRSELVAQLTDMQQDLAQRQGEWDARGETGELASSLIRALRGAGNAIVTEELSRADPLLQRIYATVDPHRPSGSFSSWRVQEPAGECGQRSRTRQKIKR